MEQSDIREEEIRTRVARLKSGINAILEGDRESLRDTQLIRSIPATVEQLFSRGKFRVAENVIQKLGESLVGESPEYRAEISEALAEICDSLLAEKRYYTILKLSRKTVEWIRLESSVTPVFRKMCDQLRELARRMILERKFSECDHILETFNLIHSGLLQREDDIREISDSVLEGIASEETVDLLLEEFHQDDDEVGRQVVYTLLQLGESISERLLDTLERSQEMSERIQILRLISEIGKPVAPVIAERVRLGGPWYYLRNLVLLLGKVGDESHIGILEPFMDHEDFRVRRETLDSICNIGGRHAEKVLLHRLHGSGGRFRAGIVAGLGKLKSREAVAPLLDMLGTGPDGGTDNELAEKICNALGGIASKKAIPQLMEIIKQDPEKVFSEEPYDEKVRTAAAKALVKIGGGKE